MALKLGDRVKETTTTTGTGALSLGGAMTGFQAFSSILSNGDTCYYALQAVDVNGNPTGAWEVGVGTYTSSGNTLSRTLITSSTGALISLAAGTTQVWIDIAASRVVTTNVAPGTGQIPMQSAGGLYAPGAPMLLTTLPAAWSPALTSANLTLSGNSLVVTSGVATYGNTFGLYPMLQKMYFEFTVNGTTPANSFGVGVGALQLGLASNPANTGMLENVVTTNYTGGTIYANGSSSSNQPGTISSGNTICVAYDPGTRNCWIRNGASGNWNGSGTANPATGVGGIAVGGSDPVYPLFGAGTVGYGGTLVTLASSFAGAVPTGFNAYSTANVVVGDADVNIASPASGNLMAYWPGARQWINYAATLATAATPTTLDPAAYTGNCTLSNGNLTVTGTNGWAWARSLNPKTTGKYYAEVYINTIDWGVGIGLANSAESLANPTTLGNDTNGAMFYNAPTVPGAGIYYNGATVSGSTPTTPPTTGATMGMAIDLGAQKVWFYNPAMGLWNNDVLANQNPAAGIGGFSISTIMAGGTGAIYLGVASQRAGVGTLNVGATAFANAVPAGFGPWDPLAVHSDVSITAPVDGQVQVYNGASGKWVNTSPQNGPGFVDGNFDFWNVNTTFSISTTQNYTADMWIAAAGTGGAATVSQVVRTVGSEPAGMTRPSKYKLRFNQTTATSSNPQLIQRVEGVSSYNGQSVTLSAWLTAAAAANLISIIQVEQNFGTGGSPTSAVFTNKNVTWNVGTTEARYSVRLDIPSIAGMTVGTNGNDYVAFHIVMVGGATFTLDFSQLQLDVCPANASSNTTGSGGIPLPFRYAGLAVEYGRKARYVLTIPYGVNHIFSFAQATTTTQAWGWFAIPAAMRASPAGSYIGDAPFFGNGLSGTVATVGANGSGAYVTGTVTTTTAGQMGWIASGVTNGSTLLFDARL